jgi:hypothetical protein
MKERKNKFDVFLSYNSVDKDWASRLKRALEERDIKVWLDEDEIRPGDIFAKSLEAGLEESATIALLVSPEAMESRWVEEEYYRALTLARSKGEKLQLIPVFLRQAKLPGFLASRRWVDFRDESAFDSNLERLIWGITDQKPENQPPVVQLKGRVLSAGYEEEVKGKQFRILQMAISSFTDERGRFVVALTGRQRAILNQGFTLCVDGYKPKEVSKIISGEISVVVIPSDWVVCPRCRFDNPPEVTYCWNCGRARDGTQYSEAVSVEENVELECMKCHYRYSSSDCLKFCHQCGQPLDVGHSPGE